MELKYGFTEEGKLTDLSFEGLSGREYVTSTKDALNVMKIKNPAVTFSENAKAGLYNEMPDEEYKQALETIKELQDLWRYPGDSRDIQAQYDMNILMLLANAIKRISELDVNLRRYKAYYEDC